MPIENTPAAGAPAAAQLAPPPSSPPPSAAAAPPRQADLGAMFRETEAELAAQQPPSPAAPPSVSPGGNASPHLPPAAPTSQPSADDWRTRYSQRGVDAGQYQSEDQLLSDLAELHRAGPQLRQYAQLGYQFAPHADQFEQFLAARQQPQPPAQPEQQVDPLDAAWGAPPYDPAWEQHVTVDPATGEYRGVNALVPFQVVDGYKKYHDWRQKKVLEFFDGNPYKQAYSALTPKVEELIDRRFQELQQKHQTQSVLAQFERENAGWLYQPDQVGQPLIHPGTGQPLLSPAGMRFAQYAQVLRNSGVQSEQMVAVLAMQQLRGEMAVAQQWQLLQQQQSLPPGQFPAQPPAQHGAVPQTQPYAPAQPAPGFYQQPPPSAQQISQNRIGQFMQNAHQNAAYASPSFQGSPDVGDKWNARTERDVDNRWFAELDKQLGVNGQQH